MTKLAKIAKENAKIKSKKLSKKTKFHVLHIVQLRFKKKSKMVKIFTVRHRKLWNRNNN